MTTQSKPIGPDHQAAVLLRAAADRIDRCGLFQGEYWPIPVEVHGVYISGDPCCALGGLALAAEIDDARTADLELDRRRDLMCALDALTEVIGSTTDQGINPGTDAVVAWWNDQPTRQAGEVVAAMRTAADRLDPPDPGPPDPIDPLTPAGPGGSSAKTSHQAAGNQPNHQDDSKETGHV